MYLALLFVIILLPRDLHRSGPLIHLASKFFEEWHKRVAKLGCESMMECRVDAYVEGDGLYAILLGVHLMLGD